MNAAGFLSSTKLAAEAKTGNVTLNAGLHDIQFALRWVQENIAQFGGDKTKVRRDLILCFVSVQAHRRVIQVTVFGESAGAIAVGGLLLANGGDNEGLFRGAIMESGSPAG